MRRALQAVAALGAVGLCACLGPYPNIGEKLDVTSKVSGRSYLTLDAGNARVLVLAPLDGGSSALANGDGGLDHSGLLRGVERRDIVEHTS